MPHWFNNYEPPPPVHSAALIAWSAGGDLSTYENTVLGVFARALSVSHTRTLRVAPAADNQARKKLPSWILAGLEQAEKQKQKAEEEEERQRNVKRSESEARERKRRREAKGLGKFDSDSDDDEHVSTNATSSAAADAPSASSSAFAAADVAAAVVAASPRSTNGDEHARARRKRRLSDVGVDADEAQRNEVRASAQRILLHAPVRRLQMSAVKRLVTTTLLVASKYALQDQARRLLASAKSEGSATVRNVASSFVCRQNSAAECNDRHICIEKLTEVTAE